MLPIGILRIGSEKRGLNHAISAVLSLKEMEDGLKQEINKALAYPAFVTFFAIIALIVIFDMVLPEFANLSTPNTTNNIQKIILGGAGKGYSSFIILFWTAISVMTFIEIGKRSKISKEMIYRMFVNLPIISKISKMHSSGEFVNSLSGRYITAEDVGMETRDMDIIREVTPHVTGISESKGGSGNPSPVTAYGVYMGMKAAANYKFGTESLEGKKILVQGVGHVGETLVKYITEEGAQVIINDINEARLEELSKKYHTNVILGNDIYNLDLDIYAPCALGATINDETIHQLNTKVIAGAANNQLADEVKHGRILKEKGIAYAPDFLINAGGIINVYGELEGYTKEESMRKTENIYNTTLEIFKLSEKENITTHRAAFNIAQNTIDKRKKERNS